MPFDINGKTTIEKITFLENLHKMLNTAILTRVDVPQEGGLLKMTKHEDIKWGKTTAKLLSWKKRDAKAESKTK